MNKPTVLTELSKSELQVLRQAMRIALEDGSLCDFANEMYIVKLSRKIDQLHARAVELAD